MAEYIEKQIAKERLCNLFQLQAATARAIIEAIPSADVQPVRHGRWIWDEDGMDWGIGSWRCSECQARPETWWQGERSSPYNKSGHYYCANCGAKMDRGADNVDAG